MSTLNSVLQSDGVGRHRSMRRLHLSLSRVAKHAVANVLEEHQHKVATKKRLQLHWRFSFSSCIFGQRDNVFGQNALDHNRGRFRILRGFGPECHDDDRRRCRVLPWLTVSAGTILLMWG